MPRIRIETLRLGIEALNVLYSLTQLYPPDHLRDGDGEFLWRAAHDFLQNLEINQRLKELPSAMADVITKAYFDPLKWYNMDSPLSDMRRPKDDSIDDTNIQKGILTNFDEGQSPITNGATLLLRITDPQKAKILMHPFWWSWEGKLADNYRNISLTFSGLQKLGLSQSEIRAFPKEFREGMEDRAALIGDTHHNHPQHWKLPARNWPAGKYKNSPPVNLNEVDLVVQLRFESPPPFIGGQEEFTSFEATATEIMKNLVSPLPIEGNIIKTKPKTIAENSSPLKGESRTNQLTIDQDLINKFERILDLLSGVDSTPIDDFMIALHLLRKDIGIEIVSVQSLFRPNISDDFNNNGERKGADNNPRQTLDHFGFRDGISQPIRNDNLDFGDLEAIKNSPPQEIKTGDILIGHSNLLEDYQSNDANKKFQQNGSFLAIRKMSQDVSALNEFLETNKTIGDSEELAARLVGRYRDGTPLISGPDAKGNTFDYEDDKLGLECPFSSHIRRTNPRDIFHDRKTPKILRRGMTYGDRFEDNPKDDRGILFMAYCSNLAEQYETIQRWANGGNSTDISSAQFDPLLAPMPKEGRKVFRFTTKGAVIGGLDKVHRVEMTKPFVTLEWGLYTFVPSKTALCKLYKNDANDNKPEGKLYDPAERGRKVLQEIESFTAEQQRREWKILLEDHLTKDPVEHNISPDVWSYIRSAKSGIYRIKCGIEGHDIKTSNTPVVLVLDKKMINAVMTDYKVFSVADIGKRISSIFNPHYIGMDPKANNDRYSKESKVANSALYNYSESTGFSDAYEIATSILEQSRKFAEKNGRSKYKIELTRQYIALVLAGLCRKWFGLPENEYFEAGGWAWDDTIGGNRKTRCPGDFFAPSRGAFYPRPTDAIMSYAHNHGSRLRESIGKLVDDWKNDGVKGTVSQQMKQGSVSFELLGRNVIGAMIGMLPPTEANLRGILFDWIDQSTLWGIQGDFIRAVENGSDVYQAAKQAVEAPLIASLSKRPAPDLLFRTATCDTKLGDTKIKAGDTVILSLVAATHGDLQGGNADIDIVFGGKRKDGPNNPKGNPHACPAQKMAMGAMLGTLTALLEAGRIQNLAASLIIEISEWS